MSTVFKGWHARFDWGLGVPLTLSSNVRVGRLIRCMDRWFDVLPYPARLVCYQASNKIDERFFDLLYLRAVVKGHPLANKRFSAVHYAGSQYDEVDISKVDNFMKLKDRASIEALIPYSSHITDDLVVTKTAICSQRGNWWCYFECVDDEDLTLLLTS